MMGFIGNELKTKGKKHETQYDNQMRIVKQKRWSILMVVNIDKGLDNIKDKEKT